MAQPNAAPMQPADLEREVELRLRDTDSTETTMISAVRILLHEVMQLRRELAQMHTHTHGTVMGTYATTVPRMGPTNS